MNETELLEKIRRLAAIYRVVFTRHARLRMGERTVSREDVRKVLCEAARADPLDGHKRRISGQDLDGDDLTVIAVVDDDVIVVTVF